MYFVVLHTIATVFYYFRKYCSLWSKQNNILFEKSRAPFGYIKQMFLVNLCNMDFYRTFSIEEAILFSRLYFIIVLNVQLIILRRENQSLYIYFL